MAQAKELTLAMIRKTLAYRYAIYSVIALAYFLVYFHRTSSAVMAPELISAFGVAPTAIGLFGSMYFYAYALGQLPAGILADRWGARKTMTIFLFVAGFGAILFGKADSFSTALIARFLVGLGVGFIYVPTMRILADWFKKDEFATYSGIFVAIGNAGSLASAAPLVALMAAIGWRNSMISVGIVTLLITVLLFIFVRNKPTDIGGASIADIEGITTADSKLIGIRESLGIVVRKYNLWTIAVMFFVWYGTIMGFQGLWAGPYLMNVYYLTKAQAGNILMLIPIGMIFGCPIAGLIADKLIKSKKKVVMIGFTLNILTWIPLVFLIDAMSLNFLRVLMFVYGFFGGFYVVLFANVKENTDLKIAGTTIGILNAFAFIGGAIYQQLMASIIAKAPVTNNLTATSGFKSAFVLCLVTLIIALAFYATQKENNL